MFALLKREILLSTRAGGGALTGVLFFLAVVSVFPFAVGPDTKLLSHLAPAILWIGALLASLLGFAHVWNYVKPVTAWHWCNYDNASCRDTRNFIYRRRWCCCICKITTWRHVNLSACLTTCNSNSDFRRSSHYRRLGRTCPFYSTIFICLCHNSFHICARTSCSERNAAAFCRLNFDTLKV